MMNSKAIFTIFVKDTFPWKPRALANSFHGIAKQMI